MSRLRKNVVRVKISVADLKISMFLLNQMLLGRGVCERMYVDVNGSCSTKKTVCYEPFSHGRQLDIRSIKASSEYFAVKE